MHHTRFTPHTAFFKTTIHSPEAPLAPMRVRRADYCGDDENARAGIFLTELDWAIQKFGWDAQRRRARELDW